MLPAPAAPHPKRIKNMIKNKNKTKQARRPEIEGPTHS